MTSEAHRSRHRRHTLLVDSAIAATVGVGGYLADPDDRPSTAILWTAALVVPLAVRRLAPATCVALVGLVGLGQWIWGFPVMGDLAVLIALYSLAVYGVRRALLVVAVLGAEVGAVLAATRWGTGDPLLPIILLSGTLTASWMGGGYVRTHRAWTASLRDRAETAERERDSRAQVAVAAERVRIARELHDVVAHSLSVMITLGDAAVAIGSPGPARDLTLQSSEAGRLALEEMKRLVMVLREPDTDPVELAPQPTIDELRTLAGLVRSAGIDVRLHTSGEVAGLRATIQLAAYRIVQEGLTNVLKHARNVSTVDVRLTLDDGRLEIRVTDDGHRGSAVTPGGLGLLGMRERAAVFDGTVAAGPLRQGGWEVTATLVVPRGPDRARRPLVEAS